MAHISETSLYCGTQGGVGLRKFPALVVNRILGTSFAGFS
jgi:hypothetical protein